MIKASMMINLFTRNRCLTQSLFLKQSRIQCFSTNMTQNKQQYRQRMKPNQYLYMILDSSQKDELINIIQNHPENMSQILKEIQSIQKLHQDNALEIFEQKYFRNYVYLIDQYFKFHKQSIKDNLSHHIGLITKIAHIYNSLGRLTFQKQEVIAKKVIQYAIESPEQLNFQDLKQLFYIMSTFSLSNRDENQLFTRLQQELVHKKDEILIDDMVDLHYNISKIASKRSKRNERDAFLVLIDMINNIIYERKGSISFSNASKICSSLSIVNFPPNKLLLLELVKVLETNIEKEKLKDSRNLGNIKTIQQQIFVFSAVTQIESNLTTGIYYFDELDNYYKLMTEIVDNWIDHLNPSLLGTIASALFRVSQYDSKLLMKIAKKLTEYDFYGFEEKDEGSETKIELKKIQKQIREIRDQQQNQQSQIKNQDEKQFQNLLNQEKQLKLKLARTNKKILTNYNNLNAFFRVLHCLGNYNIQSDETVNQKEVQQFLQYFYQVIELFTLKFQQEQTTGAQLDPKYITRCIWALCVLDTPENIVKPLNSLINKFFFNADNSFYELNQSDVTVLYYSYLYLNSYSKIFPQSLVDILHSVYSQQVLKQKKNISLFCLDVSKHLNNLKIPHNLELNVDNILVDIQIPKTLYGNQIIIDVHGYQHYFRNTDALKGSSIIKKKIIEKYYKYKYEIIPIFEWDLLDKQHKDEYLYKLFETLKHQIEQQQSNK